MKTKKNRVPRIAGLATFAALAFVFDYALKLTGFRMPFPWLPILRFDFTGIPVALSMFVFGLPGSATTSLFVFLLIVARSGDVVAAASKAISEFSTFLGLAIAVRCARKTSIQLIAGSLSRILVTIPLNIIVLPRFYGYSMGATIILLPLITVFNIMQGLLTMVGGLIILKALRRRIPSLLSTFRGDKHNRVANQAE